MSGKRYTEEFKVAAAIAALLQQRWQSALPELSAFSDSSPMTDADTGTFFAFSARRSALTVTA